VLLVRPNSWCMEGDLVCTSTLILAIGLHVANDLWSGAVWPISDYVPKTGVRREEAVFQSFQWSYFKVQQPGNLKSASIHHPWLLFAFGIIKSDLLCYLVFLRKQLFGKDVLKQHLVRPRTTLPQEVRYRLFGPGRPALETLVRSIIASSPTPSNAHDLRNFKRRVRSCALQALTFLCSSNSD
jgi:hypothetical protein